MAGTLPGFRVLLRMQIRPGTAEEFEKVWQQQSMTVTAHPANLGHWLMRSSLPAESDVYFLSSDWVDEARFREFENSAEHLEHRAQLHPYRISGSISLMRVLDYHRDPERKAE